MSFLKANFQPIGGQARKGNAPQLFTYVTTGDALAAVKASGYFNEIATLLVAKDVFIVYASDGLFIGTIAAITAGVVTMTAADINAI